MEEILIDGFLDDKMQKNIKKIKNRYKDEFNLLYKFNRLMYKIMDNYNDIEANESDNYILTGFVEINKLYQSAIIMLEYGLKNSFESLMRNILELSIQMLYVFLDEKNVYELEKNTYKNALSKLKYIRENKLYNIIPEDLIDIAYIKIESGKVKLEEKDIKCAPPIETMCNKVEMKEEYVYYRFLSNYVHQDFGIINEANIFTKDGVNINADVKHIEMKNCTFRIISSFQKVLEKIITTYTPKLKNEYDTLIMECEKMVEIK